MWIIMEEESAGPKKIVFLLSGQDGKISTNSENSFSKKFVDIVDSYF